MYRNRFKRVHLLLSFIFLTLLFEQSLFAKAKKDEVYIKYVHPRIYEFDLRDAESSVFLGYEKGTFCGYIDFTRFVKNDMPKAGDKVIFHYNGYAKKYGGNVTASIMDKENDEYYLTAETKVFAENIQKKVEFSGSISFILKRDATKSFVLKIESDMENVPGQLNQVYFHFNRVVETTNTAMEALAEERAKYKKMEIVEVQQEIVADSTEEEIAAQKEAEILAAEKERQEAEEKALAEAEAAAKAAEEAAALEKALAAASQSANTYKKEYLNDYLVQEELEPEDTEDENDFISNPDQADGSGSTLLMKAAKAGNDWQIRTLLNCGAKVNLKDKDGWNALMYAVRYQESMTCVELLINAGADIKTLNKFKYSALSIASTYNNNPEIIKKLLSYYTVTEKEVLKSFVLLLSENHSSEYVQTSKLNIYLESSIPLNSFYEGKTPLMYACQYGNSTKIIKLLLENNAVTSVRSTEGKTAYEYASENKKLKHDSTYWELNKK